MIQTENCKNIDDLIDTIGTDVSGKWMKTDLVKEMAKSLIKETAIAWSVCGSIHENYAKGKDPLYTTRHQDFINHANHARSLIKGKTE
jgi:hypothetical protein